MIAAIMAPDDERAHLIGRMFSTVGGGSLAEMLINLEEDRTIALMVADMPRDSLEP